MRKLILKIFLFLLPVLIILGTSEALLQNIPNDYINKRDYIERNGDSINVLILGSSHGLFGLNPIYFSNNTFNLASVSQTFKYDYELLKRYRQELPNIKSVIIPVSYFSFYLNLEEGKEYWRIKNYYIYHKIGLSSNPKHHLEILNGTVEQSLESITNYYRNDKTNAVCNELGFNMSYSEIKPKDLNETGQSAASRHTVDSDKNLYENRIYLEKVLKFCEENGIEVILFTPPAYKTYSENLDRSQLEVMHNEIERITSKYQNSSYYDLLNSTNFNSEDFYDADHLNGIGAQKLSLMIDSILNIN